MTRPEFRLPWKDGAYAYPEADTFSAALEGFKRRRKNVMFHMSNAGEAGERSCVVCSGRLNALPLARKISTGTATVTTGTTSGAAPTPDKWSTWDYDAKSKRVGNGRHYSCSWSMLFLKIFTPHDRL